MTMQNMTINDIQDNLITEFSIHQDNNALEQHLVQLGNQLPLMSADYKHDYYRIKDWPFPLWLKAELQKDRVWFRADSEDPLTRALVSMLIKILGGHSPKEIADADLYFISETGLLRRLIPDHASKWLSILRRMKSFAVSYQLQLLQQESYQYQTS
ncbi:SufE family protein [Chitinophaga defluvii]|uniref:SufE family protein n=1 Tax=Chitinophaga defluvii TaxID=3163343 RepID=A0ABV2SZZ3_9BACT